MINLSPLKTNIRVEGSQLELGITAPLGTEKQTFSFYVEAANPTDDLKVFTGHFKVSVVEKSSAEDSQSNSLADN